jgi:hypothetical protein
MVKLALNNLSILALTLALGMLLSSCGEDNSNANATPPGPIDVKINNYEKTANEYVRVAKKLKQGDVSITVKYIQLGDQAKKESAQLQQQAPEMTPQQVQRVASIKSKTQPYMQR